MNRTMIEWVRNPDGSQGFTWSPITGCLNQIDGMCQGGNFPCYAYRLANGRLKQRYLANMNVAGFEKSGVPPRIYNNPFWPRFWEDRAREEFGAWTAGAEPKGIFVCDMSDLFGIGIPEEWTRRILNKIGMSYYKEHRFYLLTKQPQNLIKFSPFPPNCYVGVTVTSVEYMADAVANLACTKAKVRFMSFEPLLGSVIPEGLINFLDWVIIGAQTNPYKPPKIEWVQEIVEACDKAGVAVFLKDNLKPLFKFPDHEWAYEKHDNGVYTGLLRQELPNA